MSAHPASKEVFFSYAEADEQLALELEKHLSVLKREGVISTWSRGQISAGRDKSQEVSERLSTASIILLLLSANFVASDACYSIEMQQAVERHNAGEASVIPVVLRPMDDWQNTPFGKLVALPSNGVPVTGWVDEHAAFADVARGIRLVLQGGKLTLAQKGREEKAMEERTKVEREATEKLAQTEREIVEDNRREAMLQDYIDKI